MEDVPDRVPHNAPVDYYDFSVVNPLTATSLGKGRSEAIEILFPKSLAQKLIDKSQALVNGVCIALNLQAVA